MLNYLVAGGRCFEPISYLSVEDFWWLCERVEACTLSWDVPL